MGSSICLCKAKEALRKQLCDQLSRLTAVATETLLLCIVVASATCGKSGCHEIFMLTLVLS